MRADAHQHRALQLEHGISLLGDPAADADVGPMLIEGYWAAAFHWLAFGCQQKHGQHKENHTQLGRYLADLAEPDLPDRWNHLERTRHGAMYGHSAQLQDIERARDDWQAIRTWATT